MSNLPALVVLAGGASSRFAPLSNKNLFKFMGEQVVVRQVREFAQRGFVDVYVVVTPAEEEEMHQAITAVYSQAVVLPQVGEGQAGAVSTALSAMNARGLATEDVLFVNSNDFFDDNFYETVIAQTQQLKAQGRCGLVGYKVNEYFPGGYLVVEDGLVKDVKEKPGAGNEPSNYVRLVVDYFYSRQVLEKFISAANSSKDDVYEVALADMMKAGEEFFMIEYDGVWATIKYPWHVFKVMQFMLSKITAPQISPEAFVHPQAVINGNVVIEAGVKVFAGACINGPAYIGAGTIIGNGALVRDSIVGANSVIGFGSEVARSYLADKVWLHMNYVGDSIIDSNVSFGSGAVTANLRLDEAEIEVNVKGEKVATGLNKLGAIIGSDVRLGVGAKTMPGVKIGSGSSVAPGVILNEDLFDKSYVSYTRQSQELRIVPNKVNIAAIDRDKLKAKL